MNTRCDPRTFIESLLKRPNCNVSMAAVLVDNRNIFSWGWNNPGRNGLGEHAEESAIRRANKRRLAGATLFVTGIRNRTGRFVFSKPCNEICIPLIKKYNIGRVFYTNLSGDWTEMNPV